ncbi:MAG TPA: fasciclin domain-containing protein [Gaiellaceae bacterium]|jgi:uncharacterized surface protein with fasciclin (FAS1) repeats|nr:fasciclin domain-containing protein [Gaiellaceae bacterium]
MNRIARLVALLALGAITVAVLASTGSATQQRTIAQTAAGSPQFSTLTTLLKKAGLVSTLGRSGPYTVFAPTNAAFAKVPKQTLNALLADKAKLKAVLLYHVVPGKVTAAKVVKLTSAKTANGEPVRIRVKGSAVYVNGARVTKADVMAANGVIHVIDSVLVPPSA